MRTSAIKTPIFLLFVSASPFAKVLGLKLYFSITLTTLSHFPLLTFALFVKTLDTVAGETPASLAMS